MTFLSTPADIAIYGGSAGGGKTWALLMEPLRHIHVPGFGAVVFRRTTVQIRNEGGLWDESMKLYPMAGGEPKEHTLSWLFRSGASLSMAHLEHEKSVLSWQGSQICLEMFDELTHFSEGQFFYLLSRNRSMCGVRPYVRATCNPDADSWVARFIAWWIDQATGLPIPDRAGILRYFVRIGDTIVWGDSPADLVMHTMIDANGDQVPIPPKSVTFIPAKLTDNKALMATNPEYMASLLALPLVERERLLGGNWKIRPSAGLYFNRSKVEVVDTLPHCIKWVRGWDLAATPKTETNNPDWMVGVKIGELPDGRFIVADRQAEQPSPARQKTLLSNMASIDGVGTEVNLPQDPAQAGKVQIADLTKHLAGYNVRSSLESGDKLTRFLPFSAQAEAGNVMVLRGHWNDAWFSALEAFPDPKVKDDDVDATSRAFNALAASKVMVGMLLSKRNQR